MSKTLILKNFLSDARQFWVKIIAKWRKTIASDALAVRVNMKKKEIYQLTCLNL